MGQKILQQLRSSTTYASLAAAKAALRDSTFMSARHDGEIVLARYTSSADDGVWSESVTYTKSLVGIYHKDSNNTVTCTLLTEVDQDSNHLTITSNEIDKIYAVDNKQDILYDSTNNVSGQTTHTITFKTINGESLLVPSGSTDYDVDTIEVYFGELIPEVPMQTSYGFGYFTTISGPQGTTGRMPTYYTADEKHLYVDWNDNCIYRYNATTSLYVKVGSVDEVSLVTNSSSGSVSQALSPNTFYKFTGNPSSLTLTMVSGTGLCVYAGKFTADSNGCQLTLPSGVTVAAGSSIDTSGIEGGKTYEFNIADGVAIIMEV